MKVLTSVVEKGEIAFEVENTFGFNNCSISHNISKSFVTIKQMIYTFKDAFRRICCRVHRKASGQTLKVPIGAMLSILIDKSVYAVKGYFHIQFSHIHSDPFL